jgi:hypothetical protein
MVRLVFNVIFHINIYTNYHALNVNLYSYFNNLIKSWILINLIKKFIINYYIFNVILNNYFININ